MEMGKGNLCSSVQEPGRGRCSEKRCGSCSLNKGRQCGVKAELSAEVPKDETGEMGWAAFPWPAVLSRGFITEIRINCPL